MISNMFSNMFSDMFTDMYHGGPQNTKSQDSGTGIDWKLHISQLFSEVSSNLKLNQNPTNGEWPRTWTHKGHVNCGRILLQIKVSKHVCVTYGDVMLIAG